MPNSSDLVFIIGRQRTGTTVLRDFFKLNDGFDCDEIFHPTHNETAPLRFYEFLLQKVRDDGRFIYPEYYPDLFFQYIDYLQSCAKTRKLIIDVKYYGLNLVPTFEDVSLDDPFMIRFMRINEAHVIHVLRRNMLRTYVSEKMAQITGIWGTSHSTELPSTKPKLLINVNDVVQFMDRLDMQQAKVSSMLNKFVSVESLYYDEIIDHSGEYSAKVRRIGERILGGVSVNCRPGLLKINPEPLEMLVENFSELAAALSGTAREWILSRE